MRTYAVHNGMAWIEGEETEEWAALPLSTLLPALWVEGWSHTQEDAEADMTPALPGLWEPVENGQQPTKQQNPLLLETQRGGSWKEAARHICKRSEWTPCEILGPQWKLVIRWPSSAMILFLSQKMGRGMPCLWHKKLRVLLLYILAVEVIPYSQTSKSCITTLHNIRTFCMLLIPYTLLSSFFPQFIAVNHWHSPVITQF